MAEVSEWRPISLRLIEVSGCKKPNFWLGHAKTITFPSRTAYEDIVAISFSGFKSEDWVQTECYFRLKILPDSSSQVSFTRPSLLWLILQVSGVLWRTAVEFARLSHIPFLSCIWLSPALYFFFLLAPLPLVLSFIRWRLSSTSV